MNEKTAIYIITGDQGGGKTSFAKQLIRMLAAGGIPCGGFYAEGYWENDRRSGFDLHEAGGYGRECLCNTVEEVGDMRFKRFFFKKKGLTSEMNYCRKQPAPEKLCFWMK
jgi:nucleoside-triphosphatase THEP1